MHVAALAAGGVSAVELAPAADEPEFADPALVGDWAEELPKMIAGPQTPPWCSYAARRDGRLVGFGGFKGAPDAEAQVEIGYMTLLPEQGRGVATAVAGALVRIARDYGASAVLAHTLCEDNPSTGVLRANGFARDGEGHDEDVGAVWRWRLTL